jgi:hypothetical protein
LMVGVVCSGRSNGREDGWGALYIVPSLDGAGCE